MDHLNYCTLITSTTPIGEQNRIEYILLPNHRAVCRNTAKDLLSALRTIKVH